MWVAFGHFDGIDMFWPWLQLQSEEELREFIHQTVELASTLLEQTATLKKKAGPGKSFNPYAVATARG